MARPAGMSPRDPVFGSERRGASGSSRGSSSFVVTGPPSSVRPGRKTGRSSWQTPVRAWRFPGTWPVRRGAAHAGRWQLLGQRLVVDEAHARRSAPPATGGPGPRHVSSSRRVAGSAQLTYSGAASGSAARTAPHRRPQIVSASLSPASYAARAASNDLRRTGAAARCSGVRRTLRELMARPSGSRTIGQATISVAMPRSRAMRRTTSSCWASFWPK